MLPCGVTAFSSRCENLLLWYQRALIEYTFPLLPVFVLLPALHCTSQPFYSTIGDSECLISRHSTLRLWQFSLLPLRCCPLPQSCLTIGALCRKILGAKVICLSHWHSRYPEWQVACLPRGQTSHSPRHTGDKGSCKYRRSAFRLAHCFPKHRKHHVTLQYIVTEKGESSWGKVV